jgi:hypothetical protein
VRKLEKERDGGRKREINEFSRENEEKERGSSM